MTPDDVKSAVMLRVAGVPYAQIAERFGVSATDVEREVAAAVAANTGETRDTAARLDLARLDQLLAAVWKQALRGDSTAVAQALKITGQRAELLSQINTETPGTDGPSVAARLAALKEAGADPPPLAVVHEMEVDHERDTS